MSAILPTYPTLPAQQRDWPTMYDLPFEEVDQPGMPDEFHAHQAALLNETFHPMAVTSGNYYSAIDMNLYYDREHTKWYKRPDWFGAIGVPRLYDGHDMRFSYVAWDEGTPPLIIVELLSESTEDNDLGETLLDVRKPGQPPPKWEVYERILRIPYYAVFSREMSEFRFFRLVAGRYQEDLTHTGRVWLPEAGLSLGVWQGVYNYIERLWLRWYDDDGNLITTAAEHAEQERQRAEQEWWRAEQERRRADRAEQHANQAEQKANQAEQKANQAEQKANQAEQRARRLAELLRQLGHDPD